MSDETQMALAKVEMMITNGEIVTLDGAITHLALILMAEHESGWIRELGTTLKEAKNARL